MKVYEVDTDPTGCEECSRFRGGVWFAKEEDAVAHAKALRQEDDKFHEVRVHDVKKSLKGTKLILALLNGRGWAKGYSLEIAQ